MSTHDTKKRVGLYAGTFDPVHEGHLSFAREAARQCGLDKVFFLVEPKPRRKQGVKALLHRQYMVHLSTANEPKFGSIMLDQERFSVAETMPVLRARFKGAQLYLLMADDVLAHISGWPHLKELAVSTQLIIGLRKRTEQEVREQIKTLGKTAGLSFNYNILDTPMSNISSSRIRAELKAGKAPNDVPAEVFRYIRDQGLYASSSGME